MDVRHVTRELLDQRAALVALELKDRRGSYRSGRSQPAGHLRAAAFEIAAQLGLHRVPARRKGGYWVDLGDPPKLQAGDLAGARAFLKRVEDLCDQSGWVESDRVALAILRRRWGRYASGRDVRFQQVGNYRGRLKRGVELRIKGLKQREG